MKMSSARDSWMQPPPQSHSARFLHIECRSVIFMGFKCKSCDASEQHKSLSIANTEYSGMHLQD